MRNIKITFQKIARTTIRNIMNLQSSIDNAFKHEPTYQIKIAKLENLDKKRIHIQQLIDTTETSSCTRNDGFPAGYRRGTEPHPAGAA